MSVFRIERNKNYTVMSNYHLRDTTISLKSKGLLSMMLSLPDEWNYTTRGLAKICKEGVDAIVGALRELERAGYIVRRVVRNERGRICDMEYTIYEQPHPRQPGPPRPDTTALDTENSDMVTQGPETTAQINKDRERKDQSNTDSILFRGSAAEPPEPKRTETCSAARMEDYRNIKANTGSYTAGTDKQNIGDIGRLPPDEVIGKVRKIVTGSEHGYGFNARQDEYLTLLLAEDITALWGDLLGGFAMGELGGEILTPGSDTTLGGGALQWPLPVAGTITSPQGYRTDPITGEVSYHSGTDIAVPEGTPILAAADGTVTIANALDSWGGSYGYHVKLDHGGGLTTLYAHCSSICVTAGQQVTAGRFDSVDAVPM